MIFFALVLLALFSCSYCWGATRPAFRYGDNFHVVEVGKFYRSGQLPRSRFGQCIDYYKVGMVINLRDRSEDPGAYDAEEKICKEKKIFFFNIPMRGYDLPSPEQIKNLLALYEFALLFNLTILVHCFAGIDRTGLAAALWIFQQLLGQGKALEKARKKALEQLTEKYGSFFPEPAKVFFIRMWRGKEWFEKYYKPETYQVPCNRYVADKGCCECVCYCCNCCCDCIHPPCVCTSDYWQEQFGKLNICDQ